MTAEFERSLSLRVGGLGGVAVSSGTAALVLALRALRCGKGVEVITPAYACRDLYEAIVTAGATPVLCDVGPDWLVEPENIAPWVTARTGALLLPHLYGLFLEIDRFRVFGVPIIEDCAQALGTKEQSALKGDVSVYSFHATKCLTTGEGGMCVTKGAKLLHRMRDLRDGAQARLDSRLLSPLSDLAAALGLSQLSRYDAFLRRRRHITRQYLKSLRQCPPDKWALSENHASMFLRLPLHWPGNFDQAAQRFRKYGIVVRKGVDHLTHRMAGLKDTPFRNTVHHFNHTLSLPLYPSLAPNEVDRCIRAIKLVVA